MKLLTPLFSAFSFCTSLPGWLSTTRCTPFLSGKRALPAKTETLRVRGDKTTDTERQAAIRTHDLRSKVNLKALKRLERAKYKARTPNFFRRERTQLKLVL